MTMKVQENPVVPTHSDSMAPVTRRAAGLLLSRFISRCQVARPTFRAPLRYRRQYGFLQFDRELPGHADGKKVKHTFNPSGGGHSRPHWQRRDMRTEIRLLVTVFAMW